MKRGYPTSNGTGTSFLEDIFFRENGYKLGNHQRLIFMVKIRLHKVLSKEVFFANDVIITNTYCGISHQKINYRWAHINNHRKKNRMLI